MYSAKSTMLTEKHMGLVSSAAHQCGVVSQSMLMVMMV